MDIKEIRDKLFRGQTLTAEEIIALAKAQASGSPDLAGVDISVEIKLEKFDGDKVDGDDKKPVEVLVSRDGAPMQKLVNGVEVQI